MRNVLKVLKALPRNYPGLAVLESMVVYLMGCMDFNQFCCTWRALEDPATFCPFCSAELVRRGRTPIVRNKHWSLYENEFPRKDTERMLLIIPHRHNVGPRNMDIEDSVEVFDLFQEAVDSIVPDGALVMRYGNPRFHAGTIPHLHFNVVRPIQEAGCSLPIAKHIEGPYGHLQDYTRLHDFIARVEKEGGIDWLFSADGIVKTQPPVTK